MPSETEISQTIALLKKRLANPDMDKPINKPVKAGYEQSVTILAENLTSYDTAGVTDLAYQQARAIAVLAVDYLNGECTQQVLVNVLIKK